MSESELFLQEKLWHSIELVLTNSAAQLPRLLLVLVLYLFVCIIGNQYVPALHLVSLERNVQSGVAFVVLRVSTCIFSDQFLYHFVLSCLRCKCHECISVSIDWLVKFEVWLQIVYLHVDEVGIIAFYD